MNLTDDQKRTVASWIHEGLKLSDIQTRLASDMGITVTYMEVRLLVDDLKLMPKDPPPPPQPAALKTIGASKPAAPGASTPDDPHQLADEADLPGDEPALPTPAGPASKVTVVVDKLAVPGAIVSGSVTFSDGKTAQWYLDEMGRLGLAPKDKGYRPPPQDVQSFQLQLQRELQKLGF